jgi:uridine kinase
MPAIWIPKRLVDLSLINTRGLSKNSFIRHCEFEYESRVYAAAKEIIEENGRYYITTCGWRGYPNPFEGSVSIAPLDWKEE